MDAIRSKWNQFKSTDWQRYFFGVTNPMVGVSRLIISILLFIAAIIGIIELMIRANQHFGAWAWMVPLGLLIGYWIYWAFKPHPYARRYQ